jgi:hypothetical protein
LAVVFGSLASLGMNDVWIAASALKSAYDETLATALKRKHDPQQLIGDLLKAEISEEQARSIRHQLTTAKLPLAKDVNDFAFKDTLINENLVRDLAGGVFVA